MRRLVLALTEPPAQQGFRLNWSCWRRRHQAIAQRAQAARQIRQRARRATHMTMKLALPTPACQVVTDQEWERVRPLLPPQRPAHGRPRHDHRTVLGGILWVLRTRSSWRSMPDRYGKAATAYQRYRLWQRTGLWPHILERLNEAPGGDAPPDEHQGEVSL